MAILKQWDLSFEFIFRELDEELWVKYEMYFRWDNESIIRDDILKRSPIGWASRSPFALRANEHQGDSLLPVLDAVLDTNEPDYWQPIEPDVVIGFYPEMEFPLLPSKRHVFYVADHIKAARELRLKRKADNKGKLPDDKITLMVMVDSYNWQGCGAYQGQGIALVMSPTREKLELFRDDLRREWDIFRKEQRLDERIEESEHG